MRSSNLSNSAQSTSAPAFAPPRRLFIGPFAFVITTVISFYGFIDLAWGVKEGDWTGIILGIVLLILVPFLYGPLFVSHEGWMRAIDGWIKCFAYTFMVLSAITLIAWVPLYIVMLKREENNFSLEMWYPVFAVGLILAGCLLVLIDTVLVLVLYPKVEETKKVPPAAPWMQRNNSGLGRRENGGVASYQPVGFAQKSIQERRQ
eukprot:TRINITY_DN71056_c0_g1_i1.p1 TRINITY_DN71056_c0_g1~~TRINITY_DN71056_c0_g1_i1.p1  ORF type:complete len:230 (+),score=1.27 TRINITY_DN71056_c0_g1_i1:79-690(+)